MHELPSFSALNHRPSKSTSSTRPHAKCTQVILIHGRCTPKKRCGENLYVNLKTRLSRNAQMH
eukprot:2997377-Amphidinium_carterae.2